MTTVVWFKRDLRVSDHAALAHAAAQGDVIPLYVFEPEYWAQTDVSGRQFDFVLESVGDLDAALRALGVRLVVRVGSVVDVLQNLKDSLGFDAMISHEETGNAWTFARDLDVAAWSAANGVTWREFTQSGVVRRLNGRDGWAKQRNAFLRQPQVDVPAGLTGPVLSSDDVPRLVVADHCPERQRGGRQMALSLLGSFLTERGQNYRKDMSSPVTGEWSCSRLSPYLAFGCLSGREASQAAAARQREVKGTREGWGGSLKSFQARLAWRDHFMQKLEDEPALEHLCLHSAYEDMRPKVPDAERLEAWEKGETGIPFVDACMRYLAATGWMNFRMRSMLMAVASYHLWLDWRVTGLHLARQFTDFEPGIHWPQSQMQSGTTGMNTVRIYNPIKQGKDQDPTGVFTRRWCPELTSVPDEFLQEPWTWDGSDTVLDKTYPAPIVDVLDAARAARERVWAVRRGAAFRDEAKRVIHKHASRKDPQGHFVDDRNPRRPRKAEASPAKDSRQMGFDF
ncbi:deoxyribodipyrimidine photo-lyase [Tateyamaria omphalii]|uniref:cryptochrome/deoxyribodipyrimidine photo-lyase family protein n=1 Tax=Tateyamaria omphalii TaxID=299262 RepID=UPI001C9A1585|nr:FAD-binding domain-containing protein [Tateyamaria omphalii]MBY5932172.1 deoxyribodipyrimidine photo-lyase [Tateyamaria omphalii]